MRSEDILLIFAEPQIYFFPHYSDMMSAPLAVPSSGFRHLLYKVMETLRLPCQSIFWGSWKTRAKTVKQMIIFDYGYIPRMERYIRRVNPDCQVCLFFWNKVNRYHKKHLLFSDHEAVFSTDPEDCRQYGLKYNHIFYPKEYYTPYPAMEQDKLFFLGTDKGRVPYISSLKHVFEASGLLCDIRILAPAADPDLRKRFPDIFTDRRLSYSEYLSQLSSCNVLLDITQAGQSALTMRVMEAVYLSRKLITNNRNIVAYDFYDPCNILVLPEEGLPSGEEIRYFLQIPFRPYSDQILDNYSFQHWMAQFTVRQP